MLDDLLKQAFEAGIQAAKDELAKKLEEARKKREALVGWHERSVAPERLSKPPK